MNEEEKNQMDQLDQLDQSEKDYEIAFLLDSAEAVSAISKIFKKSGIEIGVINVNQIRLAYPIKKREAASFGFFSFKARPETAAKIKSDLALEPPVIRFLMIKLTSGEAARQVMRQTPRPQEELKIKEPSASPVLTNEALEQKIEEILK